MENNTQPQQNEDVEKIRLALEVAVVAIRVLTPILSNLANRSTASVQEQKELRAFVDSIASGEALKPTA